MMNFLWSTMPLRSRASSLIISIATKNSADSSYRPTYFGYILNYEVLTFENETDVTLLYGARLGLADTSIYISLITRAMLCGKTYINMVNSSGSVFFF